MRSGDPRGRAVSRLRLACGRIAGGARCIAEAHRFGVVEGSHDKPWTPEYHREAVDVYALSLPRSYQQNIAALFSQGVETMAALSIPATLAEDWLIVTEYMSESSLSVTRWLASERSKSVRTQTVQAPEIDDHTPVVIRFDLLAALTTSEGARRLEGAALAAQQFMDTLSPVMLADDQRILLEKVASGMQIVDIAVELSYSERSIYRELAKLWKVLGVQDRVEGLRKATSQGWIDAS